MVRMSVRTSTSPGSCYAHLAMTRELIEMMTSPQSQAPRTRAGVVW